MSLQALNNESGIVIFLLRFGVWSCVSLGFVDREACRYMIRLHKTLQTSKSNSVFYACT